MKKIFTILSALAVVSLSATSCGGDTPAAEPEMTAPVVKTLLSPASGASFSFSRAATVQFQWATAAGSAKTSGITYEVLFDREEGDFSSPLAVFQSARNGVATNAIVESSELDALCESLGAGEGESVTLKWTVRSILDGEATIASATARSITFIRVGPDAPAPVKKWTWADAADSCTFTLVDSFMDTKTGIWWGSAKNIKGGNGNNYWGQAYPWQTLLYSYERIVSTDPALAAKYKEWFYLWVKNNGNNYNGVKKNGFYCQYTDDMAWICLVLIHAYDVWKDESHLTKAKEIWSYMTESQRVIDNGEKVWTGSKDSPSYKVNDEGWGLIWRTGNEDTLNGLKKDTRNACTNTPAMIIACELYNRTNDVQYKEAAIRIYDFMTKTGNRAAANGRVGEPPLTYTQGCWIEGCRLLYHITGESKYKDTSATCVDFTMTSGRCTTKYDDPKDGRQYNILRNEGSDGDQRNFKGGLMPYMINFIIDTDMDVTTRQAALTFMRKQAEVLWFDHMDRSKYPNMYANYFFGKYFNWDKRGASYGEPEPEPGFCGMHNCGAALLEGLARIPYDYSI